MKTIYEDGKWLIQMNTGGEVFVMKKEYHPTTTRQGPEIRIGSKPNGLVVTAHSCRMTPWAVNGLPAFTVALS